MNFRLALFGVLIAVSAIGTALSDRIDGSAEQPADTPLLVAATPAEPALTAPEAAPGWGDSFTLARADDGHFYADVSIDGQDTRMLVDTGASVIALTGEDAAALGLAWDDGEVSEVAQGASGPVLGVRTVLPLVELGGFTAENVPALIIPEGLFVSLLGQSFLSKIASVEMAGDKMVMSN